MVALARGGQSSAASPILDAWIVSAAGFLAAPVSLEYTIHDISTDERRVSPVQVYPPSGRATVDLEADRVSLGRYAAAWTVPGGEAVGTHQIRWYATRSAGEAEVVWSRDFDVLTAVSPLMQRGYALVSDLRAEGLTAPTDARLLMMIAKASAMIDQWTGQWFEPRPAELELYGRGTASLRTGAPIVGIASVTADGDAEATAQTELRVYNRHLRGLQQPDDRVDPRVQYAEISSDAFFGYGFERLNYPGTTRRWVQGRLVRVVGAFGYTDPDGSFSGCTPMLIREATKLLAIREAPRRVADAEDSFEARNMYRLTGERTREQNYTLGPARGIGVGGSVGGGASEGPTGDPEIDDLLAMYMAPPAIAVV